MQSHIIIIIVIIIIIIITVCAVRVVCNCCGLRCDCGPRVEQAAAAAKDCSLVFLNFVLGTNLYPIPINDPTRSVEDSRNHGSMLCDANRPSTVQHNNNHYVHIGVGREEDEEEEY